MYLKLAELESVDWILMTQDRDQFKALVTVVMNILVPWNVGCEEEDSFYQQTGLKFEEETSKMLHLEHGFVWCWNLDASRTRSETPGKFWNVVLEKDGDDQLDRSCEKWISITWSQHATNRQVAGSIPDGVFEIFQWHNPSGRTMALGSTQPLTEMSTRCISWG